MGLFGTSFEDEVREAVGQLRAKYTPATLDARVEGKVVTLTGTVATMELKSRVMSEFNAMVRTDNTVNQIRVVQSPAAQQASAAAPPAPAAAPAETVHVVVSGDTLSGLAKRYYGKASLYPKIFEANRDVLSDPDRIKVGQRLRIPKL